MGLSSTNPFSVIIKPISDLLNYKSNTTSLSVIFFIVLLAGFYSLFRVILKPLFGGEERNEKEKNIIAFAISLISAAGFYVTLKSSNFLSFFSVLGVAIVTILLVIFFLVGSFKIALNVENYFAKIETIDDEQKKRYKRLGRKLGYAILIISLLLSSIFLSSSFNYVLGKNGLSKNNSLSGVKSIYKPFVTFAGWMSFLVGFFKVLFFIIVALLIVDIPLFIFSLSTNKSDAFKTFEIYIREFKKLLNRYYKSLGDLINYSIGILKDFNKLTEEKERFNEIKNSLNTEQLKKEEGILEGKRKEFDKKKELLKSLINANLETLNHLENYEKNLIKKLGSANEEEILKSFNLNLEDSAVKSFYNSFKELAKKANRLNLFAEEKVYSILKNTNDLKGILNNMNNLDINSKTYPYDLRNYILTLSKIIGSEEKTNMEIIDEILKYTDNLEEESVKIKKEVKKETKREKKEENECKNFNEKINEIFPNLNESIINYYKNLVNENKKDINKIEYKKVYENIISYFENFFEINKIENSVFFSNKFIKILDDYIENKNCNESLNNLRNLKSEILNIKKEETNKDIQKNKSDVNTIINENENVINKVIKKIEVIDCNFLNKYNEKEILEAFNVYLNKVFSNFEKEKVNYFKYNLRTVFEENLKKYKNNELDCKSFKNNMEVLIGQINIKINNELKKLNINNFNLKDNTNY